MEEYLNRFKTSGFDYRYKNIVILVNAENKIGFSSIAKIKQKYPNIVKIYTELKLEVGELKIVNDGDVNFFFVPYKKFYKDKLGIEFYDNIAKCLLTICSQCINDNIDELFFYYLDLDEMNWYSLSSILYWCFILTKTTNIYIEKPLERLDRDCEILLLNNLKSMI